MRRRCLDEVGDFDESLAYEDYDMWLRLARRYPFSYSKGTSVNYRVLAGSLSRGIGSSMTEYRESRPRMFAKHLDGPRYRST